jgi:GDP-L-fucose synthase
MTKDLLITGGTGMIGSAIKKLLPEALYIGSSDVDLRSKEQTERLFDETKPKYVIHLAAKVGGVKGNTDFVADYFRDNILINTNVLEACKNIGVSKLVSLLSTCIYPDKDYVFYPLTENQLHFGPPHESNFGYAYAKRMLEVQSRAYRKQYGCNFVCAVPNNVYGPCDSFDLENGHVIPSLIRKVWEAKHERQQLILWGDGRAIREFTYSEDIARALIYLIWADNENHELVNIGNTDAYSIQQTTEMICKIFDYSPNNIMWDKTKPSGQYEKPSSNAKLLSMGFDKNSYTNLSNGLQETCNWFKNNYPYVRGVKK